MARYSRESRMRSIREGTIGSVHCATCGQSFWTEKQKQDHYAKSGDRTYCQHASADPLWKLHEETVRQIQNDLDEGRSYI